MNIGGADFIAGPGRLEQADDPDRIVRGVPNPFIQEVVPEPHAIGGVLENRIIDRGDDLRGQVRRDAFVGVADVKPGMFVGDIVQPVVALRVLCIEGSRKDADVGESLRDARGGVGGATVEHDDVVGETEAAQAVGDVDLLVAGEDQNARRFH